MLFACGGAEERKHKYLERGQQLLQENNYDKAQIEFKNVLQIDPKSADGWYFSAKTLEGKKKYREAMTSYNEAIQLDAKYHAARTGMARIYLFVGAADNALALSAEVLEQLPNDADAKVVHAGALYRQSQSDQALSEVRAILASNPDNVSALSLMTRMYLDMNQPEQAESLLGDAIKRKDSDELRVLIVKLYEDTKQFVSAVPHLQHLIKLHPEILDYRNRLAIYYDALGQSAQAETVLHAAVEELPDNMPAKESLIQFLAQRRDAMFARIELDKYIQEDPNNADLKLLSAQLYLQNKDIPAAEKIWRDMILAYDKELPAARARMELIRLMLQDDKRLPEVKAELAALMKDNPTFSEGMLLRGTLSLNEGRYEEAINDLRAVLKDQPTAIPALKSLAAAYLASAEPELAEEQLKMAVTLAPADTQIRIQLATSLQAQQLFAEAIEQLQLAQKLDPESLVASEALFKIYLIQKDYTEASKLTDTIISHDTAAATGYFLKGMLLQAQGKERDSIAPLERALAISPLASEPLNLLTRAALNTDQVPLITGKLQTIIKQHPEHVIAHNLLGEIALQQKHYAEADKIFGELTQNYPAWWQGWRNLAQSWLMRNQPEQAVEVYRRGVSASGDERLVISLALLYEQLKRVDEAIALYDEALKRAPNSSSFRNNLALLLAEISQDEASKDRALQLVKSFENSKNANDLDTLGWVRYQRGEYDMAINVLLQAEKRAPAQLVTQYHLAATYFAKGDQDKARSYLQSVIKAEPGMRNQPDVARMLEVLQKTG
jgi:tetratricopeptide (TPR) repeat protein